MENETDAPTWEDILPEPFVTLILGSRGAGKTALAHLLTERFGGPDTDREAYILGYPEEKADALPEWLGVLDAAEILNAEDVTAVWPEDSVVLVHEAHHLLHARRSMDTENLEVDTLITVSRHKNSDIIFETQQSQRLDRNMVTGADAIIFREPALMQAEFERSGMKKLVNRADEVFAQYVEEVETGDYTYREKTAAVKKHAYVHADRFEGEYPHEIPLADHWSEGISRAYAGVGAVEAGGDSGGGGDDGLDADKREKLDAFAEVEARERPFGWDHKGVEANEAGVHPGSVHTLVVDDLLEKSYSANSSPNQYRLTADGWREATIEEPDVPLVEK